MRAGERDNLASTCDPYTLILFDKFNRTTKSDLIGNSLQFSFMTSNLPYSR